MGQYIQDPDGKMAGSVGQGRDEVPSAPAHAIKTDTTEQYTVDMAQALDKLTTLTPGPLVDQTHPLIQAMHDKATAVMDLANRMARTKGEEPVEYWARDGDDQLVWSHGFVQGMHAVLRAIEADDTEAQLQFMRDDIHSNNADQRNATLEYFQAEYNYTDENLDDLIEVDKYSFIQPLTLRELKTDEQADIITELKGLTPNERDCIQVLLTDGWTGTYEDLVLAARALNA
jgi:hypothetical protein